MMWHRWVPYLLGDGVVLYFDDELLIFYILLLEFEIIDGGMLTDNMYKQDTIIN